MTGFSIDDVRGTFETEVLSVLSRIEEIGRDIHAAGTLDSRLHERSKSPYGKLKDAFHTLSTRAFSVGRFGSSSGWRVPASTAGACAA